MIGVFDSGAGGLHFVRALQERTSVDILYYGDLAHLPYGGKSQATIIRLTRNAMDWFAKKPEIEHVVIACNTASAVAINAIRTDYNFQMHSIILPTLEWLKSYTASHVGLLATRATIRSQAWQQGISMQAPHLHCHSLVCPLFVPLVEEGWMNNPITKNIVRETLSTLPMDKIDGLILGCTHYPALRGVLSEIYPGKDIIDPIDHLAIDIIGKISKKATGKGSLELCVSDTTLSWPNLVATILKQEYPTHVVGNL